MVVQYDGIAVPWYCSTMVLQYYGTAVLWYCSTMVLQYYGTAALWYCSTMVLPLVLQYHGIVLPRHLTPLALRQNGTMILTRHATEYTRYYCERQ